MTNRIANAVAEVQANAGWTKLPHVAVTVIGPKLGPHALAVFAALCYHASRDGVAWPSITTIAAETGVSRSGVIRAIKALANVQAIAIEKATGTSNRYRLTPHQCHPDTSVTLTPVSEGHPTSVTLTPHQCHPDTPPVSGRHPNKTKEEDSRRRLRNKSARTPQKSFVKPTLEEVQAYCLERQNGVNPKQWIAYYESNGWRVGKNPMKDWRAAVRTWEHNGIDNHRGNNGHNGTYKQRDESAVYDPEHAARMYAANANGRH